MADIEAVHLMLIAHKGKEQVFMSQRDNLVEPPGFTSREIGKFKSLKSIFGTRDYRAYARYSESFCWECSSVQLYIPSDNWYKVFSIALGSDGMPVQECDFSDFRNEDEAKNASLKFDPREDVFLGMSKRDLMPLLSCIVQYARIMGKDIRSTQGNFIEAIVLDLFSGSKNSEQVLADYSLGTTSNQMAIIGDITEVRTRKRLEAKSYNNVVVLEQFCNYSSLINFETGEINAIVLYRNAEGGHERKAFLRFDVESFVNSLCTCEICGEPSYAIQVKEFEKC